jgi:hypothetical protein
MGPAIKQTYKIRLAVQVLKMIRLVNDGVSEEQRKLHKSELSFLPSFETSATTGRLF